MAAEYRTKYYKDKSMLIVIAIASWIALFGLIIYLGRSLESPTLGILGTILLLFLPVLFAKKFKKSTEYDALLGFSESQFYMNSYRLDSDEIVGREEFQLEDMRAFRFYFSRKLTTSLSMYFKSNKNRTIIFNEGLTYEESTKQESVFRF